MDKHIAWIIGVVGSLLYSLLCAFFGYWLNSYMSRDRIAIQDVQLVADRTAVQLDYTEYHATLNCSQRLVAGPLAITPSLSASHWLDTDGHVRAGQEEQLYSALHAQGIALEVQRADLVDLLNRLAQVEDADGLPPDLERQWRYSVPPGEELSVEDIRTSLEDRRGSIDQCLTNLNAIRDTVSGWETAEKTGALTLLITLLNSGATDGLVQQRGRLKIEGVAHDIAIGMSRTYPPPPVYFALPPSPVVTGPYSPAALQVARRSMVIERFIVSAETTPPEAITALTERVKRSSLISLSVELTDMRGTGIKWSGEDRVAQ